MKLLNQILLLCIFLLASIVIPAQEEPLFENARFERLSIKDGVPFNDISTLYADSEGFLWIGYSNGIMRYDGYQFDYFDELGQFSTPYNAETQIREDSMGDLWMPGRDGQIAVYRRQKGIIHKLQLLDPQREPRPSDQVIGIREYSNGEKIILLNSNSFIFLHLAKLDWPDSTLVSHELVHPIVSDTIKIPEQYGNVRCFEVDDKDQLWLATLNGLVHFDRNTGKFEVLPTPGENARPGFNPITNMFLDGKEGLWLGGNRQIMHFDIKTYQFKSFPLPKAYHLQVPNIFMWINSSHDGRIFISSLYWQLPQPERNKLLWFDPATGQYSLIREQPNPFYQRGWLTRFCSDRSGNIWLASRGNILKYNQDKNKFYFQKTGADPKGLKGQGPFALFEDTGDIVWIGSSDGILNRWDRKNQSYQYIQHREGDPESLLPGSITSIVRDYQGILWVGSINGLSRQNPDGSFHHYQHDPDDPNSQKGNHVRVLMEDSRKNLWVAIEKDYPDSRVYVYDRNCDCLQEKLRHDNFFVNGIFENEQGTLYINQGNDGPLSYHPERDTLIAHPQRYNQGWMDIHFDPGGKIWIAWFNWHLDEYDPANGTRTGYDLYDLFPTNPIRKILADHEGMLWLVGAAGLIHFDPVKKKPINLYSPRNWMADLEGWYARNMTGIKTRSGDFIISCPAGILSFDPSEVTISHQAPQTAIVGIDLSGKPLNFRPDSSLIQRSFKEDIALKYWQNDLTIHYTGLHLKEPGRNSFAYQLQGWDRDWLEVGTQRSVSYSNLSTGDYTFRIKAANSDGVWMKDEDAARLNIVIHPPWWQTWWAYALYLMAAVSILLSYIQWRTYALRKRQKELEQTVRERTAEISKEKERSDELLLNILPSETAEELKQYGAAKAKNYDTVTVLFTDFKNFTGHSERLSPEELVAEIDHCFKAFDGIMEQCRVEKIKTVGDAYLAAAGLPTPNSTHPADAVRAGLAIRDFMLDYKAQRIAKGREAFEIRIGIHSGPVVAGIVGIKKFAYDIWGDTVNLASRMESSGAVGKVNISQSTYELLKDHSELKFESRGKIKAKNKGEIPMYFVENGSPELKD